MSSQKGDIERFWNKGVWVEYLLLSVVVAFAVGILLVMAIDATGVRDWIEITQLPLPITSAAEIAGALGSVIFTIGLVVLYREQTRIQRNQEVWMEAEHTPAITVNSWTANGNEAQFSLSNLGSGVAKNISVELRAEFGLRDSQEPPQISVKTKETPLTRTDISARVLEANRVEPVTFSANPSIKLTWQSGGKNSITPTDILSGSTNRELSADLSTVMYALSLGGVKTLRYEVVVKYDFVRRYSDTEVVYKGLVDVEADMDLEYLLLNTRGDGPEENMVSPDV